MRSLLNLHIHVLYFTWPHLVSQQCIQREQKGTDKQTNKKGQMYSIRKRANRHEKQMKRESYGYRHMNYKGRHKDGQRLMKMAAHYLTTRGVTN